MAEYWKSLPRKFCDICKCWFADNKASIDFHERGKRHKENAQKRIQDIQKRGLKEMKKQQEYDKEMEKIEKAALAAYKKDLKILEEDLMPEVKVEPSPKTEKRISEQCVDKVKSAPKKQKIVKSEKVESKTPKVESLWYEAVTEEGYKYYWNSQSSESRWEPPEEGFISIEEQNQTDDISQAEEQNMTSDEKESTVKSEKVEDTNISCAVGPQPKADPYGQWVTVEKEEPVEYDLQLPEVSENTIEVVIPLHKEESRLKFKEKVVGQISDSDSGDVIFKKRKICRSAKNARQRNMDDN